MESNVEQRKDLQRAIEAVVADSGEIVVSYAIVAEVSRADGGGRHLSHRYGSLGGGAPYVWSIIGMLQCALQVAQEQMCVVDVEDSESGEED